MEIGISALVRMWVGGGLNDNNAILNSVDVVVVVDVGAELGNMSPRRQDNWSFSGLCFEYVNEYVNVPILLLKCLDIGLAKC